MQYVPALLPSPPWWSREEEEEESLALVAIETNSLQLCCKVVRRRPGHASLSISRALPSLPCLEVWKQSLPPGPVCLTTYLLLGRKGPRVLPDSSLFFFPKRRCHSCTVSWHSPGNVRTHWSLVSSPASIFNAPGPAASTPKSLPPFQGDSPSAGAESSVRLQPPRRLRYSAPYSASGMRYRDC